MPDTIRAQPNSSREILLGLEGLRFLATFAVLLWHYQHFFYIADRPVDFERNRQPFYNLFSAFYDYGYLGVQVFWCISGFIFFWKYRDVIASKKIDSQKFFWLRFSRLYPLHFITLIIVLILQSFYWKIKGYYFVYQNNDIYHFLAQLALASNWGFEKGFSFNGPIWSVSVEVLVYAFFFIFLRYISASVVINIGIIALYLIGKIIGFENLILDCLAFFYAGGLAAIGYIKGKTRASTRTAFIATIATVILAPILPLSYSLPIHYFPVFFLFYIPPILFLIAHPIKLPGFIASFLSKAGNMTYSCYLIHYPVQLMIVLSVALFEYSIAYYSRIFFIFFISITLFFARYLYIYFEYPAQQLIRRSFIRSAQ